MYDQSYIFWLHLTYLFQNFAQRLPNVCSEAVQSLQINKNSNLKKQQQKTYLIFLKQQKQQKFRIVRLPSFYRTKCFDVYIERKVGHLAQGSGIKLH